MGILDSTPYGNLAKERIYVKQEPYVSDNGIYIPLESYVPEGCTSHYRCVMTKEMFVEAYDKFINKNQRLYKGGWRRRKR